MAFNSLAYIFLLTLSFLFSRIFPNRLIVLIVFSLTFFCYAGFLDSLVFFITVITNWLILQKIGNKKLKLTLSVSFNIALLAFFKYKNFFLNNTEVINSYDFFSDYLPLGISFYSFQAIGYQIDVYKGLAKGANNFKEFLLFKSFFPQLIAGPIVRANTFLPQIKRFKNDFIKKRLTNFGLTLILLGLIKKIVFADSIGPFIDDVFNQFPKTINEAWIGAILYSFQVYFDFSGYSDIAIGSAYLLGFRLPNNFSSPYLTFNPSGFWRSWHISLSKWIKDYIYIPLGGSKGNFFQSSIILLFTMIVAGVWHGGSLTFLYWGFFWGIYIILGRLIRIKKNYFWIVWPFHSLIVIMLWVLFRSRDLYFAIDFWQMMLGFGGNYSSDLNSNLSNLISNPSLSMLFWGIIFFFYLLHWLERKFSGIKYLLFLKKIRGLTINSFIITFGILLVLIPEINSNPFIYFRF